VSKGENLRLQCGAAPKTRGDHGTKADENRVHDGNDYDLTNDRKLCVCRSDGVFSTHRAPDSSHARNTVPIWTASAPRARAAITPRASPIPPAAITGVSVGEMNRDARLLRSRKRQWHSRRLPEVQQPRRALSPRPWRRCLSPGIPPRFLLPEFRR
jgi:hypothetical protein